MQISWRHSATISALHGFPQVSQTPRSRRNISNLLHKSSSNLTRRWITSVHHTKAAHVKVKGCTIRRTFGTCTDTPHCPRTLCQSMYLTYCWTVVSLWTTAQKEILDADIPAPPINQSINQSISQSIILHSRIRQGESARLQLQYYLGGGHRGIISPSAYIPA
jgi:hypothetical protein